jgi:carbon monoxide dehydrogenase subunit G
MQLEHQFTVPLPVGEAWAVLLDVERISPCLPGATVETVDGETITGRVKVKVGPIQVTYAGTATFAAKDAVARRAVVEAEAKEARGSGTARATITAQLHDDGGTSTDVTLTTDLAITGRLAEVDHDVMVEVGNKLLGRFVDCLGAQLVSGPTVVAERAGSPVPAQWSRPPAREPIDLVTTADLPVLRRLAPLAAGLLVLVVVWRLLARRR